jgi:hypothetical protein
MNYDKFDIYIYIYIYIYHLLVNGSIVLGSFNSHNCIPKILQLASTLFVQASTGPLMLQSSGV